MEIGHLDLRTVYRKLMQDLGFSKKSIWYITNRISCEGYKFVTVILPKLSKHVLSCLESNRWVPFPGLGFELVEKRRFPRFISVELISIFSRGDCPNDAENLLRVRQLCDYAYKFSLPFTEEELVKAESKFVATDCSITYDPVFVSNVRKVALDVYSGFSHKTVDDVKHYRSGPGTFAGSSRFMKGNKKSLRNVKDHLDNVCPRHLAERSGFWRSRVTSLITGKRMRLKFVDVPSTLLRSEVLFVPKDSRGPRTIVREPWWNIVPQMGFFDYITNQLEVHTRGRVQFTNQERFRNLAKESSQSRYYATLDLEEGSDRNSFAVTARIFSDFPVIRYFLRKHRTEYTKLPSGKVIPLRKTAGMGSGLTFPLMAATIYATIIASVPRRYRDEIKANTFVYGDDIILPRWAVSYAIRGLGQVGYKVNTQKSFSNSYFRESCGGDYFKGHAVTPVRLKQAFCDNYARGYKLCTTEKTAHSYVLKLERHCRELTVCGLTRLASYYYDIIESALQTSLPYVSGNSPVLGRYALHDVTKDIVPAPEGHYRMNFRFIPVSLKEQTKQYGYNRSFRSHLALQNEDVLGFRDGLTPFGVDSLNSIEIVSAEVSDFSLHIPTKET